MGNRPRNWAAVTVLALVGGTVVTVMPGAQAASAACGGSCSSLYSQSFGASQVLAYDSSYDMVDFAQASNAAPSEDFIAQDEGTVSAFAGAGLLSQKLTLHYATDQVMEFQYAPNGVVSGECIAANSGIFGNAIALAKCGQANTTLWIVDTYDAPNSSFTPLISGTATSYSNPQVLTSYPGDQGDPPIVGLSALSDSAGVISSSQMFAAIDGVLP
jgi:hypothetical protein